MRFTRAVSPSPVCAPARACLAAGKEYDRCRVPSNGYDYPLDQTTYYSLLRESGYHVAGCGKLDLHKKTEDWGLDGKRMLKEWGFSDGIDNAGKRDAVRSGAVDAQRPLHGLPAQARPRRRARGGLQARASGHSPAPSPRTLPDDAYCDNWLANNGLDLLRAAPAGKPWHLAVNFTGPHEPMDITTSMDARCRGTRLPAAQRQQGVPAGNARGHPAELRRHDRKHRPLGRRCTWRKCRSAASWTTPWWCLSSDHGEMLGDHDRWGKSRAVAAFGGRAAGGRRAGRSRRAW